MNIANVRETAETLKVSERHVRRMLERNLWPCHRIGRVIRLNLDEIIKLTREDAG